jgi:hypothetical protein
MRTSDSKAASKASRSSVIASTFSWHRGVGIIDSMDLAMSWIYLIEVPSLLLEELLVDFEVVSQMAMNLRGEDIPREYHEVLVRSRDMDRAMIVRTQTLNSLISVRLGMKAQITAMLTFPRSKTAGSPLEPR